MDISKEKELLNLDFTYRQILNIPKTVLFGVEIEFVDALFKEVIDKLSIFNKNDKTTYFSMSAFYDFFEEYTKWNCVHENTVQYNDYEGNVYGGEVTSPIMFNDIDCFKSLKKICDILNNTKDLTTNFRCGMHVHVDRTIYKNNAITFLKLLKMWMIFEDVIYKFSYGEKEKARALIYEFAKPLNEKIYNELGIISRIEGDNFQDVISPFKRKDLGLTFFNTKKSYQAVKNTIEARMFNGTTNEVIIQNNINFIINFLLYIVSDNYDEEYIDYEIKRFKPKELIEFQKTDKEKAMKLADMIFKTELDKAYFMKQYLKLFDNQKRR